MALRGLPDITIADICVVTSARETFKCAGARRANIPIALNPVGKGKHTRVGASESSGKHTRSEPASPAQAQAGASPSQPASRSGGLSARGGQRPGPAGTAAQAARSRVRPCRLCAGSSRRRPARGGAGAAPERHQWRRRRRRSRGDRTAASRRMTGDGCLHVAMRRKVSRRFAGRSSGSSSGRAGALSLGCTRCCARAQE